MIIEGFTNMAPVQGEKLPTTHADTKSYVLPTEAHGQQNSKGQVKTVTM